AYIGIFVTGLGYWCFFQAIKYSDASTGSVAFFIKPAIAPVIAVVILHEQLLWNTLLGIALILVASYINLRENRNEQLNGTRNTGYIQS
ncbi:MAG: DMT family transporter, partial [Anaerovoracaceae bacterium]